MKTNQQPATNDVTATRAAIFKFCSDIVKEERSLLLAVVFALVRELEPADPHDYDEHETTNAWRLAQVLEYRLSSTAVETALAQSLHNALTLKEGTQ